MRFVQAEIRRLFKRRMTRYLLLIAVLVLGAVATGTYVSNHKHGPAEVAAAQRAAQREYERQTAQIDLLREQCRTEQATGVAGNQRFPEDCEEITPPPLESFDPEWFMKPAFDFKESFEGMIITFSAILALVGFLIGASYVGAEWASGGMMNLLLWRPRRLQVLSTKLAALVGSILGVTVVLGALWTAACWAIAVWRGTTAGLTSGVWQSFALTGLRGLALVLVGTVVGFAIASIGRHTAMALGVVIALAVVGQFGLAIVLELANVDFPERWLLPYYGAAWMMRKYVMTDYSSCGFSVGGECVLETQTITWQHAGLLFGVATVVLVIVAAWTMRRRDIT